MHAQDNVLDGNLSKFTSMGNLRRLQMLDLYNNRMTGDVPPSLANLTSLQYLYVDNEHLGVLRNYYCRQRIPNNGKYSYRIVRDEYHTFASAVCEDPHDTAFAFNSLQDSGVYED